MNANALPRPRPRLARRPLAIAALWLAAAALACGPSGLLDRATDTPAVDTAATMAALQVTADALALAQTQEAQAPPTPVQLPTAEFTPEPTQPSGGGDGGGVSLLEDFSGDTGAFETFEGAQITDGEFYLGPFVDCGDLQADTPYGCFSICTACGVVSNYEMSVDVRYASGVSERTYGLVLAFEDENGNSAVDREDYYLEYQISAFVAFYTDNLYLREHVVGDPVGATGFNFIRRWDARPLTRDTYGVNNLRVIASSSGTTFELYLNDSYVDTVSYTGVAAAEGLVGLSLSGRSVQVAFDNFRFVSND